MHDANKVANKFMDLAFNEGKRFTPMQILKLVYIAHGWMLGIYEEPLIEDEIQAWQYGPVIPNLYKDVKEFRDNKITSRLAEKNGELSFTKQQRDVIKFTYDLYGNKSGTQLSSLTHQPGTPWDLAYIPGVFGSKIPNSQIMTHYKKLYEDYV